MDFELIPYKARLEEYAAARLTRSKGKHYDCPLCGAASFSVDARAHLFKCFYCDNAGDIFTLHAQLEGLDTGEAIRQIKAMYADPASPPAANRVAIAAATPARSPDEPAKPHTFDTFITASAAAMKGSPAEAYLHGRGITDESIARFNLGYDAKANGVVIPYNNTNSYYITRKLKPVEKKDRFLKPLKTIAGTEPLYNAAALTKAKAKAVFVVESQLDAITLMQEGAEAAVALGCTGYKVLLNDLRTTGTDAALFICLDNDEAGRDATADLMNALGELSLPAGCKPLVYADASADICGEHKDPNEVLTAEGGEVLRERVKAITAEAEAVLNQSEGEAAIDDFLQAVQTRRYEPMPTGIKDIDTAMHGGFIRQSLYFLGAAPGIGKTALAQWIFENMAASGTDCIYLNLEMSREQMIARSISRTAARRGYKISPVDILKGYQWTDSQREQIQAAANTYKGTIAQHLTYNPEGVKNTFASIQSYIEMRAARAEADGKPAPIVCIDYLQIIAGEGREESSELIKRIVDGLKGYAVAHKTFVLLVMAHSRTANSNGTPTQSSGRDTSAIEYSADAQLALTYTDCLKREQGGKDMTADAVKQSADFKERRKYLTLMITKGRNGEEGSYVHLHFDGDTMTYSQIDSKHTTPATGGRVMRA